MIDLQTIIGAHSSNLARVQEVIDSKLESEAPQLATISRYLSGLGGKKIRPLLTCALGLGFGINLKEASPASKQLLIIAAGIEMIHMATLLHDDIIDKSMVRRHKPSAYCKFGLDDTLLTGDFLLVRAFGLCGQLDKTLVEATESACVALTEGETLEKRLSLKRVGLPQAITIAEKKTAALFELASFSAAYLAGMEERNLIRAREFGRFLGIGFQIVDDILDVLSDDSVLGKPSGQDLREQKPSVVNIFWLESGAPEAQRLLSKDSSVDEAWVSASLKELKNSDAIFQAKSLAKSYVDKASECLKDLKAASGADKKVSERYFSDVEKIIQFALTRIH